MVNSNSDDYRRKVNALIAKSKSAYMAGDYKDAIQIFSEALQLAPDNTEAFELLKKVYQTLSEQIAQNEENAESYASQKKYGEAIKRVEKMLELKERQAEIETIFRRLPSAPTIATDSPVEEDIALLYTTYKSEQRISRGIEKVTASIRRGDYDDAKLTLEKLPPDISKESLESCRRGQECFEQGIKFFANEDFENAIAQFEKLIEISPDFGMGQSYLRRSHYRLNLALGDAKRKASEYDNAKEDYQSALKFKDGIDLEADLRLAWLLDEKTGELKDHYQQIQKLFAKAEPARLAGDFYEVRDEILPQIEMLDLGNFRLNSEKERLDKLIKLSETAERARQLGDLKAAKEALEQALVLDSKNAFIIKEIDRLGDD